MAHLQNMFLCWACEVIKVQGITSDSRWTFQHNSENNFKLCEPCLFFIGEFSAISCHRLFKLVKIDIFCSFCINFLIVLGFMVVMIHISEKYPLTLALILVFEQLTCIFFSWMTSYLIHSVLCI